MKSKFLAETTQEYEEFLSVEPLAPPVVVSERILAGVHQDLNPAAWNVFGKLSLVHLLVGVVTLSLCPQFGVRVFGEGPGILRHFLFLGHYGCMAACGAFFLGMSLLVAGLALRPEETRVLRKTKLLQLGAIASLSLGAFIMADAEILLGFAAAWITGSLLGGWAALELSWKLRRLAWAN